MSRTAFVAGNWKMNGSADQVEAFVASITRADAQLSCDLAICAPSVYLQRMASELSASRVAVGGQNLAAEIEPGAFTGEISGAMLVDVGCRYVIVGHSERRALYGETDEVVVAKTRAAAAAGLHPIVCVGETLSQREADDTEAVLSTQLSALLSGCESAELANLVIAYEPVWAIGTGRSATPEQAQAIHAFLRAKIAEWDATMASSVQIIYGGSVKADNAADIFAGKDVDGALVGGASLKADSFIDIARAAQPAD